MIRLQIWIAIACLSVGLTRNVGAQSQTLFQNGDGYNAYRIPAIVRAENEDLLAFCEAREGGDASQIDLVLKRSTDGGRTWGPLVIVQASSDFQHLFGEQTPAITVGNPAPVVDRLASDFRGRVWLPFTLENDRVFVTYSDDHGHTWAPPREITPQVKQEGWGWYATGPVHSIQLQHGPHRGRLIVPADHRLGRPGSDRGPLGAQLIYSDDHGDSWRLGAIDASYNDGVNANETTVVELNDGRLYVNTRDQKGNASGNRAAAYSSDGGLSFDSTAEPDSPFVPLDAPFDPPIVQCSLLRYYSELDGDDSNLILFCGPDESGPSGPGRSDLRIRYTTNETHSWQDGSLIHEGPAAYSDMVKLDGDDLGILFEAGSADQARYNRIDFIRLPIASALDSSASD